MKRTILLVIALSVFAATAFADDLLDEFNSMAKNFGIQQTNRYETEDGTVYYMSGIIAVYPDSGMISIIGSDYLQTISVACCVFECIDKEEPTAEKYGRILQVFFDSELKNGEFGYSIQEGCITIGGKIENDLLYIALVK